MPYQPPVLELMQQRELEIGIEISRLMRTVSRLTAERKALRQAMDTFIASQAPPVNLDGSDPIFHQLVQELGLTERTVWHLNQNNISLIGDLVQWTEVDLLKLHGFTRKLVMEVQRSLKRKNLHLGTKLPNW